MNAAAIETLIAKGLSAEDILDVARALEKKKDNTAAERQARYREKRKDRKSNARNSNGVTPPIDIIHTPGDISSNDESHSQRVDAQTVLDVWREVAKPLSLSCWDKITPKRRRAVNARLADHGFDAIRLAFEHVPKSAFLRGERGDWNGANLDFLMRPDTVPNILEGKYDDRKPNNDNRNTKSGGGLAGPAAQALAIIEGRDYQ